MKSKKLLLRTAKRWQVLWPLLMKMHLWKTQLHKKMLRLLLKRRKKKLKTSPWLLRLRALPTRLPTMTMTTMKRKRKAMSCLSK